jgi:hypothetical protein
MSRRARAWAPAVLVAVALSSTAACKSSLDEQRCDELVDHLIDLYAQDEPKGARTDRLRRDVKADKRATDAVREFCTTKMSRGEYDCMMAAKTFKETLSCDGR